MEFTSEHLSAMREAYASGVTSVSYKGRTVNYRSLAELERIIGKMEAALGVSKRPPLFQKVALNRSGA